MSLFYVNILRYAKRTTPGVATIWKRNSTIYYDFDKKCAQPNCNLKNRSVTCTRTLAGDEIISVLETAISLKGAENTDKLLQETKIHFLIEGSCIVNLLSAMKGGADMGATIIAVYSNSMCTEKQTVSDLRNLGKFISEMYNLICISSSFHSVVEEVAEGSSVPVINIGSCFYSPIDAFSFALTLFETFKRLRGLTVGIIASPNSYVNSLVCSLPRMGINVRIICMQNNQIVSVRYFDLAKKFTVHNATTLKECTSIQEVLEGADCIVLACEEHLKTQLKFQDFEKSGKDWRIACKLPAEHPVEPAILTHEKNMSYAVLKNTHYIYSALYVRLLGIDFKHVVKIN